MALLQACGYELVRDGVRWVLAGAATPGETTLAFRVADGEALVDALAATLEGTPDGALRAEVARHGCRGAAEAYVADMRALEHRPEWWELAYDDDDVAGMIMGARNPTSAVIAYVGVTPAHRGRGHAVALVRRASAKLEPPIRADTDRDNVAMARAFARAGYVQFARRRSFRRDMASPEG